jgi:hypothetical protein
MLGVLGSKIWIIFWHLLGFDVLIIYAILIILFSILYLYVLLLITIV